MIEDIAGEAASAAEMKAAASGNPLILEEMGLRQKIRRLEGARIEHEREQFRLRGLVRALRREADGMSGRLPLAEQDAARAALAIEHGLVADFGKERLDRAKDIGAAIIRAGREVLAAGRDAADLGTVGGFKAALEHVHSRAFSLVLAGAHRHDVPIDDIDNADPAGTGMRVLNALRRMPAEPDRMRARLAEIERQIPALERQAGAWPDEAELATARARHAAVIAQLRLRQGGAGAASGPRLSFRAREPVARLTGTELGVGFRGGQDMPALRAAAQRWYDENLVGSAATMRDGSVVQFNRRGLRKSTFGGKGDVLLRAVPAIRAIIETGQVVHREPGNRPGIIERAIVSAPVSLAGETHRLAVSIHRRTDGNWHYDFTFDRSAGGPGVGVPGETTGARSIRGVETERSLGRSAAESTPSRVEEPGVDSGGLATAANGPLPSLPLPHPDTKTSIADPPGGLNLFAWSDEATAAGDLPADPAVAAGTIAQVEEALRTGPAGPLIAPLMRWGRLRIITTADLPAGMPDGVQAWADGAGRITLIADAIEPGTETAVLLHEAFHAGVRPLIGDPAWNGLMRELETLRTQARRGSARLRGLYDEARRSVGIALAAGQAMPGDISAEEFGAYLIEHYEAAPPAMKRWVDRIAGLVKAWLLRTFGRQFGAVTPEQLRALAAAALRAAAPPARAAGGADERGAGRPSLRHGGGQGEGARFAAGVLVELTANDDIFQNPRSRARDLGGVFADIMPEVTLIGPVDLSEEDIARDAEKKTLLRTGAGRDFHVYEGDGTVWLDVSRLDEGQMGSAVYAAVANYAYNTGRVFIGDPAGLSDLALRRRTEAMLSSALKFGTTDHLAPHPRQVAGDARLGVPPLRWTPGDTMGNIAALIDASLGSLAHDVPEVRRAYYDFETGTFRDSQGAPLSDEVLDGWASRSGRVRAAGAGRRTLKRGILLNTVARAESGAGPGLLELVLRQQSKLVARGGLGGLLYSVRGGAGGPAPAGARRRLVDGLADRLTDLQPAMLATVPLNYFSELKRPNMAAVDEYLRLKRAMDAYRGRKHDAADQVAQAWLRYARLGLGTDGRARARTLADLMHDATLAGIDPSLSP